MEIFIEADFETLPDNPEPGAQQEAGENEPGFFMVHRLLTQIHTAFQSGPEGTDKSCVPFALWHSQNLLQVSNEPCRCERLSLPRGPGKPGPNARPSGFECVRRDIRLYLSRSRRRWPRLKRALAVLFVLAEIEFERPRLPDALMAHRSRRKACLRKPSGQRVCAAPAGARREPAARKLSASGFAVDSLQEGTGFEPSVPQQIRPLFETVRPVSHHGLISRPGTDGSNPPPYSGESANPCSARSVC